MKTFKLITLQVVEECGLIDIKLKEGLVINKEDKGRTWLLEAYVSATYEPYFRALLDAGQNISLQVVITRAENDPAYFQAKSLRIKKLTDGHLSVLFKGTINQANTYPELLLTALIEKGLCGQELLDEFKEKMITKPKITPKN
ncbi:YwpF family protein [Niallia oryzisoli]|uniref:YwpF family protein n=1 Tax=Niallia oryzisoli TaxID=1737571 RepID=A0ABZ2CBU2_9BACI